MNYKFPLAVLAACLALSACKINNATSGALTSAEAQNVDTTYQDYQTRINNGSLTTTTPTGQATMAGYVGVSGINPQDSTTTAMGNLNMDVDFDAGTLTGKASNFGIYNGSPLTKQNDVAGTLDVTGTVSGASMSADATGALSDGSSNPDFNLKLTGKFYDDAGTLTAVGDVSGTMTDSGTSTNVSGNYYATKQ